MMPTRSLVSIAVVVFAAGCQAGNLEKVFGKNGAQDVITRPDKVQAYRLEDDSFYQPTVSDYKTTAGPVGVSDELAKQASKLLLDSDSYVWEAAKGCLPEYGVRLEFIQGDQKADVFFCFGCDILDVYFQGKPVGGEDFDNVRPQLVKVMQQIFPNDEAIQGLKAKR